ncbi:MAG TPA: hypothetical protein VGF15_00475 [Solirubrobacteraceae bacterium]
MQSRQLQQALTDFIEQAAQYLQCQINAGCEVPFELASSARRRGGVALQSYRPLTDRFITEHWTGLRELPAYTPAASLTADAHGLERYLLSRGISRMPVTAVRRAESALLALLEEVFAEQSDFELRGERVPGALESLEGSAGSQAVQVTVLATLGGIALNSAELALARGLSLVRSDEIDGVPEQALTDADGQPQLLVIFTSEEEDVPGAVAQGAAVLRELLRALRLFGDGRIALGELAWRRVGAGAWQALALGGGGRPHGMLLITEEQQDELRAFCNLVSRRAPEGNELAWALDRFQMGCERGHEYEALSDYLLALRALLEPEGASSGLLAGRLAALCATAEERTKLIKRMIKAQALERAVIAGSAARNTAGENLIRAIADHLRALLRDVICGHLDPDLVLLADELLAPPAPSEEQPLDDLQLAEALGISEHSPVSAYGPQAEQPELWEPAGEPLTRSS